MKLAKYLANLGYGTRRDVEQMIRRREVTRADGSPVAEGDDVQHDELRVRGVALDPAPDSVLMLNKPVGYVCSSRDAQRLVYELLPPRLLSRSPVMAPIGRLDRDTSGLLLLTDDGRLNHRLTSPRSHVAKTYEVTLAESLRGDEGELFASGTLVLESELTPLAPARLEVLGDRSARLTITEGRYHQVRRMFVAAGNHVVALHRSGVGQLELGALPSREWRLLGDDDLAALLG